MDLLGKMLWQDVVMYVSPSRCLTDIAHVLTNMYLAVLVKPTGHVETQKEMTISVINNRVKRAGSKTRRNAAASH